MRVLCDNSSDDDDDDDDDIDVAGDDGDGEDSMPVNVDRKKNLGTSRSVTLRARFQFGTRGAESTTNRRELDDQRI